ncbi:MAG: hypothetical protein H7Y12_01635 [Sphingobacteriaceae bacterium]|nr:hypothetical protein [Cytophagaceae bacterium]
MLLPRLIALLKADQTPELDGFFIVKLQVSRHSAQSVAGMHWRRFPGGLRGAVITHTFGDRLLRAVLLRPQAGFSAKTESSETMPIDLPVAIIRFSAAQVENFIQESGDENPNHRGESAVVPGLLMARTVEEILTENGQILDEFEFYFIETTSLGQPVFLFRENKSRWAGRNEAGRRVFELSISGESPASAADA